MRILALFLLALASAAAFRPLRSTTRKATGARGMTAVFDALASLALASKLSSSSPMLVASHASPVVASSMTLAKAEKVQGMYKEYTVDRVDDSALDEVRRNYKTAEETDDSKAKYWTVFAVLLGGSFIIPMVQYYWYVKEED